MMDILNILHMQKGIFVSLDSFIANRAGKYPKNLCDLFIKKAKKAEWSGDKAAEEELLTNGEWITDKDDLILIWSKLL